MNVVVYSPETPCTYCHSTKLRLAQKKIPFEAVTADEAMIDQLRGEGHESFPVVKVELGDGASWAWTGFRFDHLNRLAELFAEAA